MKTASLARLTRLSVVVYLTGAESALSSLCSTAPGISPALSLSLLTTVLGLLIKPFRAQETHSLFLLVPGSNCREHWQPYPDTIMAFEN